MARLVNGRGVLLMFPDLQSVGSVLFRDRAAVETTSPTAGVVALGRLVVDPDRQQVSWGGQVLPLTRLEREVLAALASPPLRVWTYRNLYERAWGAGYLDDASAVRSTVKRLRGKLRTAGATIAVESVRGVGFSLVDTSVSAHLAPSA
ncbi:MAG TPA: winged helix-turn-helix domain-containing protein [Micromonosporaceae bacterium]